MNRHAGSAGLGWKEDLLKHQPDPDSNPDDGGNRKRITFWLEIQSVLLVWLWMHSMRLYPSFMMQHFSICTFSVACKRIITVFDFIHERNTFLLVKSSINRFRLPVTIGSMLIGWKYEKKVVLKGSLLQILSSLVHQWSILEVKYKQGHF